LSNTITDRETVMEANQFYTGDMLEIMRSWPDKCVDLTFCSPPYEDARTYGIAFKLKGQAWVDWAVERFVECVRVTKGLVCWNVEGKTRNFRWSATPVLMMADLHRKGVKLRKPGAFHRIGIPGSGGPDWLRNDWEFLVCASHGKLPWSDNTAMGHPPKWAPGGEMSNRLSSGARVTRWGHPIDSGATVTEEGGVVRSRGKRPSHRTPSQAQRESGEDGSGSYLPPVKANPGNVIHCKVGGGLMGSKLAHENEAPFPESLAEVFVRSFCPPGGIVLDPFAGSFTTCAVAQKNGRQWVGIDIRESQIELGRRRMKEAA
jgi:site-specific DNA-methyltransferase (adenine-specific)